MSHFFISYSHADDAFVEELEERMEKAGLLFWTDKKIKLTQQWRERIDNAIHECAAIILVVTEKSMNSHYVTYEWSYAMGRGKKVVQIVLQRPKEIHPKLEPEQHMIFDDTEASWKRLLDELHEIKGGHKIISPEIANAEELLNGSQWLQGITQLKDIEDDEAVEALVRGLEKKSLRVSLECALALSERTHYKDERALPRLSKELSRLSSEYKRGVVATLGSFGTLPAFTILVEAFNNPHEKEKNIIANYILEIDIPENREFITTLITGDNLDMCVQAIKAIQRFRYTEFSHDLRIIAQTEINKGDLYISARMDFIRLVFDTLGVLGEASNLVYLVAVFESHSYESQQFLREAAARPLADNGIMEAKEFLSKRSPNSPTVDP